MKRCALMGKDVDAMVMMIAPGVPERLAVIIRRISPLHGILNLLRHKKQNKQHSQQAHHDLPQKASLLSFFLFSTHSYKVFTLVYADIGKR